MVDMNWGGVVERPRQMSWFDVLANTSTWRNPAPSTRRRADRWRAAIARLTRARASATSLTVAVLAGVAGALGLLLARTLPHTAPIGASAAFSTAAFTYSTTLGWVIVGCSLLFIEWRVKHG